jgi:Glycosyl transferases group 1
MKISFLGNFSVDYSSETHHAKTLELMGHEVIKLQEGEVDSQKIYDEAIKTDVFIWIHTHSWVTPGLMSMGAVLSELKKFKISSLTYHLDLWLGLEREKDLETDPFYRQIDHFFATDKLMADWFNKNTDVKGHYLPAGVFEPEAIMLPKANKAPDVVFVGSKGYHHEWPYRPLLIDWLEETYGDKFGHYSGEAEALGLKRGLHLNQLYADAKIVVGDTLCLGFDYPYYFSDRLFETTGRGGFLIFPYIKGLEDNFEIGKEIVTYTFGDFEGLKDIIDYYLEHDEAREKVRKAGYERTIRDHTYTNRWETILGEVL